MARVCDVVLTSRPVGTDERVPLAGVPYHSVEPHIAKLVNAGYKVAIAEQLGNEPPPGEKLVERVVRRVVTAGTVVEPGLLDEGRNNYLAAVAWERGQRAAVARRGDCDRRAIGLAYADITTGEFAATQIEGAEAERLLREELARLQPAEMSGAGRRDKGKEGKKGKAKCPTSPPFPPVPSLSLTSLPAWQFELETARRALLEQFEVESLAAFGCEGLPQAVRAAGALVQYLRQTQRGSAAASGRPAHLQHRRVHDPGRGHPAQPGADPDHPHAAARRARCWTCWTPPAPPWAARLLRKWLHQPLLDLAQLEARLDGVQAWHDHLPARTELRELLRQIGDLERWTNRAAQGIARPQELVGIRQVLGLAPEIERSRGRSVKCQVVKCQVVSCCATCSTCCARPSPRSRRPRWTRAG